MILSTFSFAHWTNKSALLTGPDKQPSTDVESVKNVANNKIAFSIDKQLTTKWTIRNTQPVCTLSIFKGSSVIGSHIINTKSFTFKQQLDPGSYTLISSSDVRISVYEWRTYKLKALVPIGGGNLSYININNKKESYYRASSDTIPVFKITGPTIAFTYVRCDVPKADMVGTIDVTITDKTNNKVISHKTATKQKSKKAVYLDNVKVVPGHALIISYDVPSGEHEYSVLLNGNHGIVKMYAETQKKKTKPKHQKSIAW
jgi:hypothetical protein